MLPQFPNISLSLEQEFDLRKFQTLLKDLSNLEMEELLIMVLRQKMAYENISKSLIKEIIHHEQMNVLPLLNQA